MRKLLLSANEVAKKEFLINVIATITATVAGATNNVSTALNLSLNQRPIKCVRLTISSFDMMFPLHCNYVILLHTSHNNPLIFVPCSFLMPFLNT